MKVKHTPAPWPMKRREVTAPTGEVYQHFEIGSGWKDGGYLSVSGCIDEADARLIAAAPELLEALQAMVDGDTDAIAEASAIGIPFPEEMLAAYRKAVAAIAKANGEQE